MWFRGSGQRFRVDLQDVMLRAHAHEGVDPDLGFGVWGLGFGVWGLGSRVGGLGFGVWGLGSRVWGLGFGVWDLGFGV